jgi:hypothetical protein
MPVSRPFLLSLVSSPAPLSLRKSYSRFPPHFPLILYLVETGCTIAKKTFLLLVLISPLVSFNLVFHFYRSLERLLQITEHLVHHSETPQLNQLPAFNCGAFNFSTVSCIASHTVPDAQTPADGSDSPIHLANAAGMNLSIIIISC